MQSALAKAVRLVRLELVRVEGQVAGRASCRLVGNCSGRSEEFEHILCCNRRFWAIAGLLEPLRDLLLSRLIVSGLGGK